MLKSFPWCATWIFCKCDTIKKKQNRLSFAIFVGPLPYNAMSSFLRMLTFCQEVFHPIQTHPGSQCNGLLTTCNHKHCQTTEADDRTDSFMQRICPLLGDHIKWHCNRKMFLAFYQKAVWMKRANLFLTLFDLHIGRKINHAFARRLLKEAFHSMKGR